MTALMAAAACAQTAEKPADNTKIFGAPPPKADKTLYRTVNGTIKDADGNLVGGALVYLKDMKTGKERSIVAGPNGNYLFEDLLKANDYQVRAVKGKAVSTAKLLSTYDTRAKPSINLTLETPPPSGAAKQ